MTDPYPRDLIGYGAHPPDPLWPGGARLALQIVMNYEEGGERSILHGDETAEAFLQEVVGAPGADSQSVVGGVGASCPDGGQGDLDAEARAVRDREEPVRAEEEGRRQDAAHVGRRVPVLGAYLVAYRRQWRQTFISSLSCRRVKS